MRGSSMRGMRGRRDRSMWMMAISIWKGSRNKNMNNIKEKTLTSTKMQRVNSTQKVNTEREK